jgi:hypothetical protein
MPALLSLLVMNELNPPIKVEDCENIRLAEDKVRIYYQLKTPGNGFYFYACEWAGSGVEWGDHWGDSTYVKCLFHGVAMFDGIRHLYMGDEATETENYIDYPNTQNLAEVFKNLKVLEEKYCSEVD